MKKKKLAWLVALCTAVMIITLAVSFYLSSVRHHSNDQMIVLPGQNGDEISVSKGEMGENAAKLDGITIDKTNVKKVIATLVRPQEYYMEATTSLIYHSDKNEQNLRFSVKGDMAKIQILSPVNVALKHIIITPYNYYSWNNGARGFYKGARGDYSYDDAGAMPTYEDVLNINDEEIIDAAFVKFGSEACIFVAVNNALSGAQDSYYISVSSGLLYASQSKAGGMMVYEMQQTSLEIKEIANNEFNLPTGQLAE